MKMLPLLAILFLTAAGLPAEEMAPFEVTLRHRVEKQDHPKEFVIRETSETWKPAETALIVCDVWDSHHSKNAADRTAEVALRINEFANACRKRGALIIHAPSDCMKSYEGHPGRQRAKDAPKAANLPGGIEQWLHWKDEREKAAGYPIDASDGGQDDTAEQLATWHAALQAKGRNPSAPWLREIESISIDPQHDAISDQGVEVWNLLESRGIKNVFLCGVHTNMCVLGRPFGLRQLSKNGRNVALVRDLTDTMYNPARSPQVNHFRGTDLVLQHVEKYVCPTLTSDQVLGGVPFHFTGDKRKHLVMVIGEDEYKTAETLPAFADAHLGPDVRVSFVFAKQEDPNDFATLPVLADADLLIVSVRRRFPTDAQMKLLRDYLAAGKPVVGIRTASHAWSPRQSQVVPSGHMAWPEWDAEVLSGNYQNHYGNELFPTVRPASATQANHPILTGICGQTFVSKGSLYKNTPLQPGAELLLEASLPDGATEPVAWVARTKAGGRVFYTSLGHPEDFQAPYFQKLLAAGIKWALEPAAK